MGILYVYIHCISGIIPYTLSCFLSFSSTVWEKWKKHISWNMWEWHDTMAKDIKQPCTFTHRLYYHTTIPLMLLPYLDWVVEKWKNIGMDECSMRVQTLYVYIFIYIRERNTIINIDIPLWAIYYITYKHIMFTRHAYLLNNGIYIFTHNTEPRTNKYIIFIYVLKTFNLNGWIYWLKKLEKKI